MTGKDLLQLLIDNPGDRYFAKTSEGDLELYLAEKADGEAVLVYLRNKKMTQLKLPNTEYASETSLLLSPIEALTYLFSNPGKVVERLPGQGQGQGQGQNPRVYEYKVENNVLLLDTDNNNVWDPVSGLPNGKYRIQ